MHRMRPFHELATKEDALRRLLEAARPIERVDTVALREAVGRACAEDVRADLDVPPFARATMDGYALRAADGDALRRVVGDAFAGRRHAGTLGPREAVRIATGAPVPTGADAVVRVEDASEEDGLVRLTAAPRVGQSIDEAGADIKKGELLVARGAVLTPARLGVLASVGRTVVRARARPRVAVLSTGDELLAPGEAPRPDAIYDSNSTSLSALLARAGADATVFPPLRDELAAHETRLLEATRAHDVVLLSGGASVGSRDFVIDALRRHGEVILHGVRVKPGKPLLVGRVGDSLVVGLPGNPVSALSNAALFVLPALRRLAGLPPEVERAVEADLGSDVTGEPQRFVFLPVKLEAGRAVPTFKSSGSLTSLSESDGWIGVPEGVSLKAGTRVKVTLWP